MAERPNTGFPYRIAVLCDLRDAHGRILLIHRTNEPNRGLHSPIGGKLDTASGESPAMCAQREIREEAGIDVPIERLHLGGMISEHGYEGQANWLLFWYRVLGPVEVQARTIREGELGWHEPDRLMSLALPETDRDIIWPLVLKHDCTTAAGRPGFFAVHIDCTGPAIRWEVQESFPPRLNA